ncbi:hypothetical protein [Desulfurivibrio dismutans]|uniref:hypothetical protein n=1 Tax=Desulfurivibrio dismutans TaxID=1398908 RepID=UPI0023DCD3E6|nr:hypothetical protein [Desulfurivibrio alkaliphilus]MDF1615707.1 hypothetical protein [Desulfurivibrio alkaliphilus]
MLKQELIAKNPIRHLKAGSEGQARAQMGLVMARAGLGKTAMLVQIALDSLLNGKQVIHVSIGQSLEKTRIWYDDIFKDIVEGCKLASPYEIYDEIMRNRMIMTFKESSFSRARLEERLNDLVYQNLIRPGCMVVDGYDFTVVDHQTLQDLGEMARAMDLEVWFSAVSHQEDEEAKGGGVPAPCHEVADLFDTVVLLQPAAGSECIDLNILKDTTGKAGDRVLQLDPITFMVKEGC